MTAYDTASIPGGTRIGNYRLLGLLGRGGMGAVYRAEQLTMQREVALKILHPKRMRDPKAVQDFLKEARIAAALDHQGLVPVYDVGSDADSGLHYYSMKLVTGRTLNTVVAQGGPMSFDATCAILHQVASAVGHAHNRDIIHRDLKPANIILTANQMAVVTDLGLAMDRFNGHKVASKRILKLVGTAEYAAPEQLRNPDRATAAADVWALGAIAYFLLTGEDPFTGETLLDLVVAVASEQPARIGELPEPARMLVDRLMAKDPKARPQDGLAAVSLIDSFTRSGPPTIAPVARRRDPPGAGTRRITRRRRR